MRALFRKNLSSYTTVLRDQNGKPVIGFIGLGNMGGPMAKNLVKKGYTVNAFDLSKDKVAEVVAAGARGSTDLRPIVENSDTIVASLPNTKICEDVFLNTVFKYAKPGSLMIDSSTIAPSAAQHLYEEAKKKGYIYLDAPVSGGVTGAAAGTLTFMIGAPTPDIFKKAEAIVLAMGKGAFNCGKPGAGQIAKACNNLALGIEMVGVCEALQLGRKLGIDLKILTDIMKVSTSRCWSVDTYNPVPGIMEGVPASRNYENGFSNALIAKDLSISTEAAKQVGANLPLGELTKKLYDEMAAKGYENKDFGYAYQYLDKEYKKN